ncbi:MAG: monovalent cation/H+ antiporter complex subunit F [Chloroflexota bacterium]|nr:monovalent cation/H+ antiporter complex subunit F [Chloroflexota bacterium]
MHDLVFYIAVGWMTALLGASVVLLIRARSITVRILALDLLTLILVGLLVLYAAVNRQQYYMDAALILALVSFVSTLATARYHSEGQIF